MFEFETEQELEIRQSVRKVAEKAIPPFQKDEFYGALPRHLFSQLSDIGLAGLSIDLDHGGIDATCVTSSIVMEELAKVDLGPAIFVSVHSMVCRLLRTFGSPKQHAELLPPLARGELLGAFALTEPSAGSDASSMRSVAVPTKGGYLLSGEKCYITSAGWADLYILFAKTSPDLGPKGVSAFVVEGKNPKLHVSKPDKKMGCELSPIASLSFQEMFVPDEALIGTKDDGYRIALSGLGSGRVSIAACANGISRDAIERARTHLGERKQFGKLIGEFQGLQFMLADMQMKLEAAQLLTWQAARELDEKPSSAQSRLYPSYAKCFATDAAMQITTDAVQLLGGAGYLREYTVERRMRDAKMLQIVEGTNQIQRMVIARELL